MIFKPKEKQNQILIVYVFILSLAISGFVLSQQNNETNKKKSNKKLKLDILGYYGTDVNSRHINIIKLRLDQSRKWMDKYGKENYEIALKEILQRKLKDTKPDIYDLVTGDNKKQKEKFIDYHLRRDVMKKFVQIAPENMLFEKELKGIIENKNEFPIVRIVSLQTLLRRKPTEKSQKYAFEKMKRWIEHAYETNENEEIAKLAGRNVGWILSNKATRDWLKEYSKKPGSSENPKYTLDYDLEMIRTPTLKEAEEKLRKLQKKEEVKAKRQVRTHPVIFSMNSPVIRKRWRDNPDQFPVELIKKYCDSWIELAEDKDTKQRRHFQIASFLKVMGRDVPDRHLNNLDKDQKKNLPESALRIKYNLDAYELGQ